MKCVDNLYSSIDVFGCNTPVTSNYAKNEKKMHILILTCSKFFYYFSYSLNFSGLHICKKDTLSKSESLVTIFHTVNIAGSCVNCVIWEKSVFS